jgi:hypothetical protein
VLLQRDLPEREEGGHADPGHELQRTRERQIGAGAVDRGLARGEDERDAAGQQRVGRADAQEQEVAQDAAQAEGDDDGRPRARASQAPPIETGPST